MRGSLGRQAESLRAPGPKRKRANARASPGGPRVQVHWSERSKGLMREGRLAGKARGICREMNGVRTYPFCTSKCRRLLLLAQGMRGRDVQATLECRGASNFLGVFDGPNWTAKLALLRLGAAVDLMKILGVDGTTSPSLETHQWRGVLWCA